MRVRKEPWGWNARGVIRRDAKHTKTSDAHRPVAAKKDTKKWCGGKVGREHQTVARRYTDMKHIHRPELPTLYQGWWTLVCTACGKELENYWPLKNVEGLVTNSPPPAWVPTDKSA